MKKVLVIGGGLAGLSTAVYLSKNNFNVTLLEASPKLGGRTYSFFDKELGLEIDNGQHIMMSCYRATLDFLDLIGSKEKLYIEDKLDLLFINPANNNVKIKSFGIFYPFDLLVGLLFAKGITLLEKYKLKIFFVKLIFQKESNLHSLTVFEWLKINRQPENLINNFWSVLVIGTMNTTIEKASARTFFSVLKNIFLKGGNGYKMVIPNTGLSKIFCEPAENFISEHNCKILKSEKVEKIITEQNKVVQVHTNKNHYTDFDYLISAIPYNSLNNLLEITKIDFQFSPIITVHVKMDTSEFDRKHYAFLNSPVHWVFVHHNHISCVTSSAEKLVDLSEVELKNTFLSELRKIFPGKNFYLNSMKVIKEKRATFIPSVQNEKQRIKMKSTIQNLFIAGDWVTPNLPSTIEGAILSGINAAFNIVKLKNKTT
ncbi:MAG: oleate hydratase [Melioribacteraceae bacterium]|nr:oleate hydratase [Melioribacteraceae bacterium]